MNALRYLAVPVAMASLLASFPALSGEDADLDLIPDAVQDAGPVPPSPAENASVFRSFNLHLMNSLSASSFRERPIVPRSGGDGADVLNRLVLDGRATITPTDAISLTLSDRFGFTLDDSRDPFSRRSLRNDLRELYATVEPAGRLFLEVGRINLKFGAASGYNPTDVFRAGSAVDQSSSDPTARRENRLGTVMARVQHLWDGGAASLIYAPRLADAPALNRTASSFDPQFDSTNHDHRLVGTLDLEFGSTSAQVLAIRDGGDTKFGLNLSATLSDSIVGYAEWAGGWQRDLIGEAYAYGRRTGTFPAALRPVLAGDGARRFRNDLVLGLTWSSEAKVTVTAEYQFRQSALDSGDWDAWFDAGRSGGVASSQVWFVRSYANVTQTPATAHRGFLRLAWSDAVVPKLDLTAFTSFSLIDGSGVAQLRADYPLSDQWSVSGYLSTNYGGRHSEFGSLPEAAAGIVQLVRYF